MKRTFFLLLPALLAAVTVPGSGRQCAAEVGGEPIPEAPVYADTTQWHVSDRRAAADIFYIISTETGDYPMADGRTCHYADTYADSLRAALQAEMEGVDTLVSGRLNFFAPYYRQCSMQSFQDPVLMNRRLVLPLADVRRAFSYYMAHLNGGRPFILAGFSQGALLMLELQKSMDEEAFSRMIAAYAIGVTISADMLSPRIVAARGADDTGVTICYNSVRADSCAMPGWEQSAAAINPVNWRTDGTPATLVTEPSPLVPVDRQQKDTMTVSLSTASGLLHVGGYTATDYVLPLIGREGNYHGREIWLYRDQLRRNMALRASRW